MAGTDSTKQRKIIDGPVIILCEPQLGENIGMAARAMANFGLTELRLVNPRDGWPNENAQGAAAKAHYVIERAELFDTTTQAIADLDLVLATTARNRDMFKPVLGPKQALNDVKKIMLQSLGKSGPVRQGRAGILFGRERWGLNNDEVAVSDAIITLPVEPSFASLNIAQAVLILAYEWRQIWLDGAQLPFESDMGSLATKGQMLGLFEHLEDCLDRAGYFLTPQKRPSMVNNLRTMLTRARFNEQEVRTLRGVIASLDRRHLRQNSTRLQPDEDAKI